MVDNPVRAMAARVSNWEKWGPDDEAGTLNYITPDKIVRASQLVKAGKVFALAIPFDRNGPQTGHISRFNPIHVMLADGANATLHPQGAGGFGYADDMIRAGLNWMSPSGGAGIVFDGRATRAQGHTRVRSAVGL